MTRLILTSVTAKLILTTAASAYGRKSYYSYSNGESASYTSRSSDSAQSPASTDAGESSVRK